MKIHLKKFIALTTLVSFLMVVFFSFSMLTHRESEWMQGVCPITQADQSLCIQGSASTVLNHISAYSSFINIQIVTSLTVLILMLILVFLNALGLFSPFMPLGLKSVLNFYNSPLVSTYKRKITRWLSLFENSPSLILSA